MVTNLIFAGWVLRQRECTQKGGQYVNVWVSVTWSKILGLVKNQLPYTIGGDYVTSIASHVVCGESVNATCMNEILFFHYHQYLFCHYNCKCSGKKNTSTCFWLKITACRAG